MVKGHINRADLEAVIKAKIDEMILATNANAPEIHRFIQDAIDKKYSQHIPHENTIRRRIRELRPKPGDPWDISMYEGDDARLVLDVVDELASRAYRLDGETFRISHAEAQWVILIRKTAPDLNPYRAYLLARMYASYTTNTAKARDTSPLDAFLALKPWKSKARAIRYGAMVIKGYVKEVPAWYLIADTKTVVSPEEELDRIKEFMEAFPYAARMNASSAARDYLEHLKSIGSPEPESPQDLEPAEVRIGRLIATLGQPSPSE